MNPLSIAQLIFAATQAIGPDVEAALTAHWGKDHVQQALGGLGLLTDLIQKVGAVFEGDPAQAEPSDQMGAAPTPS